MSDAKSATNMKAVTDPKAVTDAKSATNLKPVTEPAPASSTTNPIVDPAKAKTWFLKAATTEKTQTWDYAIMCYVMGLQFEPDNLEMVKRLMQVAKNRKAGGGKSATGMFGGEKFSINGKGPLVPWLQALESLAKDPENPSKWEKVIKSCSNIGAPKAADFLADQFLQMVRAEPSKSNKMARFTLLKEHFKAIEQYSKARLAAEEAFHMSPDDLHLQREIKDLAALHTTKSGNFESAMDEKADFRTSVKDFAKQVEGIKQGMDNKSEDFLNKQIADAKVKHEKEPQHTGLLRAYAAALLKKESDAEENKAIELLESAFESTKEYQLHIQAQEVNFRQRRRKMRLLKEKIALSATPEQQKAAHSAQLDQLTQELLADEIASYRERGEKYPTDKEVRYELGTRCLQAGMVDEAIDALQIAEAVPKLRIKVLNDLGQAFMRKEWFPEAVETFQRACKHHEIENDPIAKELHYNLACALEANGNIAEAMNEYSQVARWQLTFKDVRDRLQRLRNLKKPGT